MNSPDTKTYLGDAKTITGSIPLGEYRDEPLALTRRAFQERCDDARIWKDARNPDGPAVSINDGASIYTHVQTMPEARLKVIGAQQMQAAFISGIKAKDQGFMRVTPYYECPPLDHFWLAGYDGKSLVEAANGLA